MKKNKETVPLECPECGRQSDSIKQYTLPYKWIFLGVVLYHQDIEYTCCPECMRKHIFMRGFTYHILTTHVMWPFFIFPWSMIQLLRSFTKGHSKAIQELIAQNTSQSTYPENTEVLVQLYDNTGKHKGRYTFLPISHEINVDGKVFAVVDSDINGYKYQIKGYRLYFNN